MIRVEGLHKRFGAVTAVVAYRSPPPTAQSPACSGPNGAGKTTALRMIYGLMKPDGGRIEVDGQDMPGRSAGGASRVSASCPMSRGLYPRLTAREHIHYFGRLHGFNGAANSKPARSQWIDLLDMSDFRRPPRRRASPMANGPRWPCARPGPSAAEHSARRAHQRPRCDEHAHRSRA